MRPWLEVSVRDLAESSGIGGQTMMTLAAFTVVSVCRGQCLVLISVNSQDRWRNNATYQHDRYLPHWLMISIKRCTLPVVGCYPCENGEHGIHEIKLRNMAAEYNKILGT